MTQIKLTKNELRDQQLKLAQLERYLPTLQLKKALLQTEVNNAEAELAALETRAAKQKQLISDFAKLLSHNHLSDLIDAVAITEVKVRTENIAGVEIPLYEDTFFREADYSLFDTPLWLDSAVNRFRALFSTLKEIQTVETKKALLQKELRDVSIRVNLFEKILIPRSKANIKKIKVFLGDQQLSAVAQAKVAKTKIDARKKEAIA
ncbi:MAG: V-type ATP synthase subunit D [Chlamydiia bacterium]|nr:V-type ATP synthase subunit D [Chlamydiia bacterium]HPE85461.1 V-type ATP synthase subunit D [Chlamydiales bacterium]